MLCYVMLLSRGVDVRVTGVCAQSAARDMRRRTRDTTRREIRRRRGARRDRSFVRMRGEPSVWRPGGMNSQQVLEEYQPQCAI